MGAAVAIAAPSGSGGQAAAKGKAKGQGGGGGGQGGGGAKKPDGPGFQDGPLTAKGTRGTINPLQVRNPLCRYMRGKQKRNCRTNDSPESPWSVFNYGLDIHVDDSGSLGDQLSGNFQTMLATIANAIWMGTLLILKLILTLLGWAFELNPFTNNRVMSSIATGLERFYRSFTQPWLLFALVALGSWAAWRGLARRQVGAAVGGTALAVLLMVAALVVIHQPRQTVGRVSSFVNQATLLVMSAPQGGPASNPASSYGEATAKTWEAMTTAGFTALNFSDANWALGPPDPELKKVMEEHLCDDIDLSRWGTECRNRVRRLGTPRSNVELFLRSSPNSGSRGDEMWDELDDSKVKEQYLNVQGGGSTWVRLPLVFLVCAGLLGAACLLGWLALRIFGAAAMAFVLVLATPLALFFPAFGEGGRRAFQFWGTALVGSLLAKLIYGALLAVVLFGTGVIYGAVGGKSGVSTMMGFLLVSGLWWIVFLKRSTFTEFFQVAGDQDHHGFLGGYFGWRLGSAAVGAMTGGTVGAAAGTARAAGQAGAAAKGAHADKAAATKAVARGHVDRAAKERLDQQYAAAKSEAAAQEATEARAQELRGARESSSERAAALARQAAQASDPGRAAKLRVAAERAERDAEGYAARAQQRERLLERREASAREARKFVADADERERDTGSRWSAEDIRRSREELRHSLNEPPSSPKHAHYVGMSPRRYESLRGREREEKHREVEQRIREDKRHFGVIPDRPAGAPARDPARTVKGVAYRVGTRARSPVRGSRQLATERLHQRRARRRGGGGALRPRGADRRGVSR